MALQDSLDQLKGFDVSSLDFNNAGTWPLLIKMIVMIVLFAAVHRLLLSYRRQTKET